MRFMFVHSFGLFSSVNTPVESIIIIRIIIIAKKHKKNRFRLADIVGYLILKKKEELPRREKMFILNKYLDTLKLFI